MNITNFVSQKVKSLRDYVSSSLSVHIRPGQRVAVIDFPGYTNVGDSAIWLATKEYLKRAGVPVAYACDILLYDQNLLRQRVGLDGIILINGGGNIGDLWPRHEYFRYRVLEDFKGLKVIQLPQSIHFDESSNLKTAAKWYRGHSNFVLFVRDQKSYDIAMNEFKCQVYMCPDMVFLHDLPVKQSKPQVDVVGLLRSDAEKNELWKSVDFSFEKCDWIDGFKSPQTDFVDSMTKLCRIYPKRLLWVRSILPGLYDSIAAGRLAFGVRLLNRGRVVVTDRLHGHILCTLLGVPHVFLDNKYGKIKSFSDAWKTQIDGFSYFASDVSEVKNFVDRLTFNVDA